MTGMVGAKINTVSFKDVRLNQILVVEKFKVSSCEGFLTTTKKKENIYYISSGGTDQDAVRSVSPQYTLYTVRQSILLKYKKYTQFRH